ncbi:hypothetical protein PQ465_00715 [Sphingobacterium oryzagri]|uniref:Uncharacterized protein n=1 Tax=Sphingobacterium oryzagri TaxID=3025669 RepID=A0ABY7WHE1_9SPHI|nr:hypothetical protein [Sphingobacterium sp. KACC 22765]WDF68915.1 hypothetical protein PQ465_00715 [Sphingobacterium sp. KACC 22765]
MILLKSIYLPLACFILLCAGLSSCDKTEQQNRYAHLPEPELERLANEKYQVIIQRAQAQACTNADQWALMDMQTVCGLSHLAYHKSTDVHALRALVRDYEAVIAVYRPMILPVINCRRYEKPSGIFCQEGKPVVAYPYMERK